MSSSPEDKRRRARKRRRSEVNEKKIALVKTFRMLKNAIEDLAHTAMSRKRSHSSSSSSTSDSSASSSSSSESSTSTTSTSGSSTSTESSSEEENRRHRRVSQRQRSRSRSRIRRYRKYKDGRSRRSRSKSYRKSRSRDPKSKSDDKKSAKESRKRLKIDESHETTKNTLPDSRDDSQSVKSQSEPGTSGLAVKISCDSKNSDRGHSKSRTRSTERKRNREKDDTKSDDGERDLDCRQDSKVAKEDSQVKCKRSQESDIDHRNDKQNEASGLAVKSCCDSKKSDRGDSKSRTRSRERKKNRERGDTKSDDGARVLDSRQESEVAKKDSRVRSKHSHESHIDDRNDKQNEVSGLPVKSCSDDKKTDTGDSKRRSRSKERKKNDTKLNDRERVLDRHQDSEVSKKDSRVKKKHCHESDIDGSVSAFVVSDADGHSGIDKKNNKHTESPGSAVKIYSDDKKSDRDNLKSQTGSRDKTRKNKEKDATKSDDREGVFTCRQDSPAKSKRSHKNDMDGSSTASAVPDVDIQSVNEDRNEKLNEASTMAVKISGDHKKTNRKDLKSQTTSRDKTKKNKEKEDTKHDDTERFSSRHQKTEIVSPSSEAKDKYSHKTDIKSSQSVMMTLNVDGEHVIVNKEKKPTKFADDNSDTEEKETQKLIKEKSVKKDDDAQAAVLAKDNDDREKSETAQKSKDVLQDSEYKTEIISKQQMDSSNLTAWIHVVDGKSCESNDNETIIVSEDSDKDKSEKNIPKKSEEHSVNIVEISEIVDSDDSQDDDVANKLQEVVDKVLESLQKKDQNCDDKLAIMAEETDQNIEVVKNDTALISNDSQTVLTIITDKNKAETILKNVDDEENVGKNLQKKEEAVNKDAMLPDEETVGIKIDLQNKNAQKSTIENESSDEENLLQDLLSWFPPENFCDSDDDDDKITSERRKPEEKVMEFMDAEVLLNANSKDKNTEMTLKENDALMTDKETNIVVSSSEQSQTCKFDADKAKTNSMEEDEYKSKIIKKNDDISPKDKQISNASEKADEAEEFVLEFVDNEKTTNEQEKSAGLENGELIPKESWSETEIPKIPTEEEKSPICKKLDDSKDEIEKEEKLEETSIQEKNGTQKSKEVNDSAGIDNCEESEISEMHLEEFSDTSVSKATEKNEDKVEENQSKILGNLQENESMVIEESLSQDDEEEDYEEAEDSKNGASEETEKTSESLGNKTPENLPTLGLQSLLYNMCRLISSKLVSDKTGSSKAAAELETHSKSDFASEDVTKNGSSCKNTEKILPEEIASTSGLQIVSSDQITEKNAPHSEENISQPTFLRESENKGSMLSAVTAILETAVKPFEAIRNEDLDEKELSANLESSEESVEEFSSQETENCAEREPTANPKSSEESVEEFSSQETDNCAEKDPITALKSSAGVEKELSQETENFAENEIQMALELPADFAVRESANLTKKESITSKFPADSAEKFSLHEIAKVTEKKSLLTSEFIAESSKELALQETGNELEKESYVATKVPAESAEKLASETGNLYEKESYVATKLSGESTEKLAAETGNLNGKQPAMPSEFATELVEEFSTEKTHLAEEKPSIAPKLSVESTEELSSQETEKTAEEYSSVASELPTESVNKFLPLGIENFTDIEFMEVEVSNSITEETENTLLYKSEQKIDENVPAASFVVEINTNYHQENAEDPQKVENINAEQIIVDNVPAVNSTVEIITTDHQEVENKKAQQEIVENVPAAHSTVEIITNNHQEVENKKAEQIIEENVPASNSTVEITTTDHQKNAEDTQELDKKSEQQIDENVPTAISTVEITTTDHQDEVEDTQEVEKNDPEQMLPKKTANPMLSAVDEILTSALEKFGAVRRRDLTEAPEGLTSQDLAMTPQSPSESSEDFISSDTEDFSAGALLMSPEFSEESMEEFPTQEIEVSTEKVSASIPEILSKSSEEFPSQEINVSTEKSSPIIPEILSKSSEDFSLEEIEVSTEKVSAIIPEILSKSSEDFPTEQVEVFTEKSSPIIPETLSKSSEDFSMEEIEVSTEKVPSIIPESLSKSSEAFSPQEMEVFTEKSSPMAPEIPSNSSEQFPPQEMEVFTEKSSQIIPEILSKPSKDFPLQEMEVYAEKESTMAPELSTESVKELALQDTENFAVESQIAPELSKLSEESSSWKILSLSDKETPVALKLSAESQKELISQETQNLDEKEPLLAPNLPAESSKAYSLQETEKPAEKKLLMAPKISIESQEEFFSQETERELSMAPKLLNESNEESPLHDINNSIEKEPFMASEFSTESSEVFPPEKIEDFAKKDSFVVLESLTESSLEISSLENSDLAEKEPRMVHKLLTELAEETPSQKIVNLAEKYRSMAPKFPGDSEQEFPQETKNFAEKEPSILPNFTAEPSAEFSSQKTGSVSEKESSVAPEFPTEPLAEFSSQETEIVSEKESSMALEFSAEPSQEFSPLKTGSPVEKEPSMAPKSSEQSLEEFSSQETGNSAENEPSIAPKLSKDSSEEFYSQETGSPAEIEPSMAPKLSVESSEEFSSPEAKSSAKNEPSMAPKLSKESSAEFSSPEAKSSAKKEPQTAPEFPEETSQEVYSQVIESSSEKESPSKFSEKSSEQFYSQETGSVGEKNSPMSPEFSAEPSQEFSSQKTGSVAEKQPSSKFCGEFSDEFSSQETKSSDEKEPPVASAFPAELSREFSSPETESFAKKEPAKGLKFPVQLTQEFSSQQVENLAEKEAPITPKFSQDLPSQNTENLPEVTPMEIDSPDISDTENVSSDSSLEIISKVEAEREDYESYIYTLKRQNLATSVNSSLQDEKAKTLQTAKNILPLITNIIKINPKEINIGSKFEIPNAEKPGNISNRSRQEIVDKYRALPSSRNVVCKLRKNLKRPLSSSTDVQILPNSATNSAENLEIGSPIDSSLANEWTSIMRRGLSKETKEQLMAKHRPAENIPALKTPLLNTNLRHYMAPSILRKDRQLVSSQNQLAAAISAVGKVFSIIQKENVAPEAMQTLGEAGKILADLHHENYVSRRSNLTPEIGNYMENVVGKNVVDRLLFTGNDPENVGENRPSTSGREIEMQKSEELTQKILRFKNKSAENKSDGESDQEFLANFSGLSDIASLISNDDSAEEKSNADFFGCLSSNNEDFEQKSNTEKIDKSKTGSQDSQERTTTEMTQPEVSGIRKSLFSSSDVEKSGKAFAVDKNGEKFVSAAPKSPQIQPLAASHDPETQKSDTTDSRSVNTSNNEDTDLEQKSTTEKICVAQSGSQGSPEIIIAGKVQPEVTETIKTSISSKEAEKSVENFSADKIDQKIVSGEQKMTEIPSSIASNDSAKIKSQPTISGMIKPSVLSNEAEKSVEMLAERATSENQFLEPKIVPVETLKRIMNQKFERSHLPTFSQGNRLKKKPEQSDSPRSSKIVIKSDTLVKPQQKLSIVSVFPPKSVSFASPTIPPQGKQRQGTPWKSQSIRNVGLFVPSSTASTQVKKQIPEAWGTVKVQAKGAGYAILQMTVQYNVDIKKYQTPPPVQAFDLVVRPHFYGRNQSHITYFSCQRWINTNESSRSGMAVLDVTIPTGYIIQQQNLDRYIRSRQVRNLQRARFQDRKVLFYFDYLDQEETCVNFTVERWFPVANMSRYLPVRVYDYYSPERFNETIFDALATYVLNICEVCGSSQCPYCHIYNAASLIVPPTSFVLLLSVFTATARYFRTQEFSVG